MSESYNDNLALKGPAASRAFLSGDNDPLGLYQAPLRPGKTFVLGTVPATSR